MQSYQFGSKEEKKEIGDPVKALQDAIDDHGDFEQELDGSLSAADLWFLQTQVALYAKHSVKEQEKKNLT